MSLSMPAIIRRCIYIALYVVYTVRRILSQTRDVRDRFVMDVCMERSPYLLYVILQTLRNDVCHSARMVASEDSEMVDERFRVECELLQLISIVGLEGVGIC